MSKITDMWKRILSCIGVFSVVAINATAQTLSVSAIEAGLGEQTELVVSVEGATEMTAMQCTLTLPEGFSFAYVKGQCCIRLGDATNEHMLSIGNLSAGGRTIMVYSTDLDTFSDGVLFSIPVKVPAEVCTVEGILSDVHFSTVNAVDYECSDVVFTANVTNEFTVDGIKYVGDVETWTATVVGVEDDFSQVEVSIPTSYVNGFLVTTIGDRSFANNKTITSVTLPNSVKSIEEKAFRGCTNLQSISLGTSLETIGNDAFRLCENLASIEIPNSVYEIGENAFYQCVSLRSVVLPTSLKAIRTGLFSQCGNLESVEIPNSVEVIETWAFMYCESLKSITIPSSVVSIIPDGVTEGYLQFNGCSQLESIVVEEGNPVYDSRNNANAIIETSTNTLIIGCNNSTVPEGVERVDDYAFYDFKGFEKVTLPSTLKEIGIMAFNGSGLKSIEIPASIESLGEHAFNGCKNLRSAVLPNTLTSIPASLFIFCENLEEVNIPNGVESIGDMAFRRCGFSAIEIPNTVKTIGEQAFQGCVNMEKITIPSSVSSISERAFQNCDVLHTIVSQVETPFAIESNVFSRVIDGTETPTTATLYVPKGSKELYKSTEGWNQFATILEEGETPEHTPITAISELKNTVLYAVSQPHHPKGATSWAVQEGGQALKSSNDLALEVDGTDARQQFAFVSNDDGTTLYLYHAAEAKFVGKDGSLSDKPVDAIQFKAGAYDNTFVAYFDGAHYINVGGSRQMIIDGRNTADGGNSCVITPVGEFDPTEALALIKAFETGVEMTTDNGQQTTVIYDLQGRRVEKVVKGIYIINGKKVVIK